MAATEYGGGVLKYRIERWLPPYLGADQAQDVNGADAKYHCALILLEWPEALVKVEDRETGRRYVAKVRPRGVAFERVPDDGVPTAFIADIQQDRRDRYAAHVKREERRRHKEASGRSACLRQRRQKAVERCVNRPVICVDTVEAFASVAEAAEWNGVKQQSVWNAVQRGRRCRRLLFVYAADLIKELEKDATRLHASAYGTAPRAGQALRQNHAALLAAAQQAVLLWGRKEVQALPR